MAATLKVTPEEVRAKAKEIEAQKNAMERMMNQMKTEVNKLPNDYWKSTSGVNYGAKYETVQKNCQGSLEKLMAHIRNLFDTARIYDEVEQRQITNVGALDGSKIF